MRRIVCGLIRGKYVKDQNQMLEAKKRDSPLWKAICKEMPFVMEGMGWSLGNGRSVKFLGGSVGGWIIRASYSTCH